MSAPGPMRLVFIKGAGKYDRMVVERDGRAAETVDCPKQGIIPHDMVHFAIESTLSQGGFLTMVADGAAASFRLSGGAAEEAVERLVETAQAELWGGRVPTAEFLATYRHACEARGHPALPVSESEVAAIRARLDELGAQWAAVGIGQELALTFPT